MLSDRKELLSTFRSRLGEVVNRSGMNRSQFATATRLDRSTLTQLLSNSNRRLPRLETVTQIALAHQVSLDWLMGLSHDGPMQAEVMSEQTTFAHTTLGENEERLLGWFHEAVGYKVRYVPATLPDLLKSEEVIDFEYREQGSSVPRVRLQLLSRPRAGSTQFSICCLEALQSNRIGRIRRGRCSNITPAIDKRCDDRRYERSFPVKAYQGDPTIDRCAAASYQFID